MVHDINSFKSNLCYFYLMGYERQILSDYYGLLEENRMPKFKQSKFIKVDFSTDDNTNDLWKKHEKALEKIQLSEVIPEKSLLDLKIEIAKRIFKNCHFCERRCGIDRIKESGVCNVKEASIASEFLHMGEEYVLVPSHTIFFSGCTFKCVFCQNYDISQRISGIYIQPEKMAEIIKKRKNQGSKNVNWVGGDPTPNLLYILFVLKNLDFNIPQIWNSNMFCSMECMKLLNGIIDLYLTDFKYGNDKCAKKLSKVENYFEIVSRNHKIANDNGDMIIRHLVMPNHVECCSKPIIDWISENISDVYVNVMGQYEPVYNASDYEDIERSVSFSEVKEVKNYAKKKGLFIL